MMNYDKQTGPTGAREVHKRPSIRLVDPRDTRPPRSDSAADRAFLDAHRAELSAQYPDEFVAVVNGALIDHDAKLFPLGERVRAKTGCDGALFWFTGSRRPEFSPGGKQVWP
jgi:hypothetical protein